MRVSIELDWNKANMRVSKESIGALKKRKGQNEDLKRVD
jgi:hypothetical protein